MPKWNEVEVPRGTFVGWGKKGQRLTLRILDLSAEGGKDFNQKPCPRLTGTLVEDGTTWTGLRQGETPEEKKLETGEVVNIEGGTYRLRQALLELLARNAKRDDLVRVTYTDNYETDQGSGKDFKVEHAPAEDNEVQEDDL